MKILVTGGTGFLGTALVKTLRSAGHQVIFTTRREENIEQGMYNLGDISAQTNWTALLQGCDTVIHTAGRAHILKDDAEDALTEFRRVNHDATMKLANDAANCGVKHFIFVSSIGVNGNSTSGIPFSESTPARPTSDYAISKLEAEESLLKAFSGSHMAITIVRPALICGPNAPGNIQRLLKLVSKNLPLPFKSVKNKRALVSLDNVVSFISECTTNEKSKNELYLLADQEHPSTEEMITAFSTGMGMTARIVYFPRALLKIFLSAMRKKSIYDQLYGDLEVDSTKSREQLQWTPPVTLQETMVKTAKNFIEGKK
ncbi:NAD-dependent epimerase/dehydratase family protein [Enterobacter bugandensis]|jgi:nucleoside-diphosphate-sugar epimerase|uniref:NAD-dependent epimerase/dehydratase family protein n=1 Tax=Enterobacter bugandensis TaxID=881260 RepID=UPI000488202E|nr:NAD-dependent epimerase/dehydratase family protein [Enterobacter bugandensis]KUR00274.1 NAD-dependent epimerase [Enterobacter bugandensis]MCK6728761.1 NAD-dependent epimerase/dehydratase family protein [Enterobacter bugandensis]MCK6809448.1 NAD-dependent epimerase/dehydratase family protein [Enterobacter bugandensis]MCK7197017.1 NAD-dependent epimerase/dehydratase family protein [Enterobacter bugandensis]MCK7205379.1 NAD-dependent epimerase/dehydratase family protein [Enterobacter bugandens